jgi:hypothetical protein
VINDGHRLQLSHSGSYLDWDIVCPVPELTPIELDSEKVPEPECRRTDDGAGRWVRSERCLLAGYTADWEGPDEDAMTFHDGDPLMLADLPLEWEWPVEDRPRMTLLPDRVMAERDRARATTVALEQQVDLLCKLIGYTATVLAANGGPHAADQLVRNAERITDPDAGPVRTDFLDGLRALLDSVPPEPTPTHHAATAADGSLIVGPAQHAAEINDMAARVPGRRA